MLPRLVDHATVSSNFTVCPCERTKVAHLHHSSSKIPVKASRVVTVSPDQSILRTIVEELLVRAKKATACHKLLVVVVVEGVLRGVERGQVRVTARSRASSTTGSGESRVDVGGVVYAVAERGTLGETDGVAAGERCHLRSGEAFGGEVGNEGCEVGERRGDFGVGLSLAGCSCIPPS